MHPGLDPDEIGVQVTSENPSEEVLDQVVAVRVVFAEQISGEDAAEIVEDSCNDDGEVDLSDAVCNLDWLFANKATPGCIAALNNLCVWVKDRPGMGAFYRSQHELVFVFKSGDAPHRNHFELGLSRRIPAQSGPLDS